MHYYQLFRPNSFIVIFLIQLILIPFPALGNSDTPVSSEITTTEPFQTNAFWLGAYLGGGSVFDTDRDDHYTGKTFSIRASANFRYHHTVLSCGFQGSILNETHYLDIGYITCGKSIYQSVWQEILLSAGISRNQLRWADDMSDAKRIDAICVGIPLQFQYLFHLPIGIGGGMALDLNLNNRAILINFSFQIVVGAWSL